MCLKASNICWEALSNSESEISMPEVRVEEVG